MSRKLSYLDYQQIDAANWSTIKVLEDSPLHYQWALEHEREATKAMLRGLGGHTAILDPDSFMLYYVLCPLKDRRGNDWKEFAAKHEDKTILFKEDYQRALDVRDAVLGNVNKKIPGCEKAKELLAGCETEKTIVWTNPETGIKCKARLDAMRAGKYIVEIKLTSSIQMHKWQRQAASMKYHGQMAMQREAVMCTTGEALDCYVIAIEDTAKGPIDVGVFYYGPDELERGEEVFHGYLHTLKRCREENRWPGRHPEPVHLELPAWEFPADDNGEMTATVIGGATQEQW